MNPAMTDEGALVSASIKITGFSQVRAKAKDEVLTPGDPWDEKEAMIVMVLPLG
jgi:hypothetical protein